MATNLQDVIARLEAEIASAKAAGSRIGFFASLYRRVTLEIKRRIEQGLFENPAAMLDLDVDFATRYFDALDAFRAEAELSECWRTAFEGAGDGQLLIVQHLLLGMNAHINFDLAISTAKVARNSGGLAAMQNDFNDVNDIFGRLIEDIESRIGEVSPLFHQLDALGGDTEEIALGFSIRRARRQAWRSAQTIVRLGAAAQLLTPVHDGLVAGFGEAIISPVTVAALKPIRERESANVAHIIDVFERG